MTRLAPPIGPRCIAQATAHILAQGQRAVLDKGGLYHLSASGETTWYGFARKILRLAGDNPDKIKPIKTEEYPAKAKRPRYGVLSAHNT